MPFDYTDPVGKRPDDAPDLSGPPAPTVGYGEDIVKSAPGAISRGITGTIGASGSLGELSRAGLTKLGVPDAGINFAAGVARSALPFGLGLAAAGPSGADLQGAVERVTGPQYQAQTVPGQYTSTALEFAPSAFIPGGGSIGARAFNTLVPALTSETAGQFTKDTVAEPYARFLAGFAGVPFGKLLTPAAPTSAVRQGLNQTLTDAGVPLTAGNLTGSKPIQWVEASAADMPFAAGKAAEINAAQQRAYQRNISGAMFDPAQLQAGGIAEGTRVTDPAVYIAGKKSLKDEYTRLTQNDLTSDPQLHTDLWAQRNQYEKTVPPSQRTGDIEHFHNDIVNNLVQRQGTMPGDVYQSYRSLLGDLGDTAPNAASQNAYRGMQTALDDAMKRGLSTADAEALALNNQRYAIMKTLEPVIAKSGEFLSPLAVDTALRAGRPEHYAARAGALDEFSHAAKEVLKPLPQSGTGPRLGAQAFWGLPTMLASAAGAYGSGGSMLAAMLGTGATIAAPFAGARLALSGAGQRYLGNQVLPQNARDAITQAIVEQAASQPGVVERNKAGQAAVDQRILDNRRKAGLAN